LNYKRRSDRRMKKTAQYGASYFVFFTNHELGYLMRKNEMAGHALCTKET
jgi:hypothetical protein